MKASEVIAELTRLIAEHGDLDPLYECQGGLLEIEALEMNEVVFLKPKDLAGSMRAPFFVLS